MKRSAGRRNKPRTRLRPHNAYHRHPMAPEDLVHRVSLCRPAVTDIRQPILWRDADMAPAGGLAIA